MKKMAALLLMLMLVMAAGTALALTEFEWNLRCSHKLVSGATLYECYVDEDEASSSDLHISHQNYRFEPVGSLAAGSYVTISDLGFAGKTEIAYYSNGARHYAFVDSGCVGSAFVTVKVSSSEKFGVPEVCYANPDTWYMVLSEKFGAKKAEQIIAAIQSGGNENGSSGSGGGDGGWQAPKTQRGTVRLADENGEEQEVTLITLGTAVSVVKLAGEKITVPTADLRWDTTADEDEMLAVIKAHKTGKGSLRMKASNSSSCIEKITTNRIVLVVERGRKFTKVLHEGKLGYIVNTALTFYPVGGVKEGGDAPQPGWVSFRGKLKSRNTINIRQNGKNGSRILDDFIAGTPVMVFSQEGKWSEIDVGGYRAYILTEYVTLDDGTVETE